MPNLCRYLLQIQCPVRPCANQNVMGAPEGLPIYLWTPGLHRHGYLRHPASLPLDGDRHSGLCNDSRQIRVHSGPPPFVDSLPFRGLQVDGRYLRQKCHRRSGDRSITPRNAGVNPPIARFCQGGSVYLESRGSWCPHRRGVEEPAGNDRRSKSPLHR